MIDRLKEQIKHMTVVDIGILKFTMIFFGLWIAKILPSVLVLHQWVYLGMWIIGSIILLFRLR